MGNESFSGGETAQGWKPMLHYAVAWRLWVRGTRLRKHFDRSLDTPESIVA